MSVISRVRGALSSERTRRAFAREYTASASIARPGRYPVVVVLDHPKPRRNVGCIVRSADAFGARGVYVVGTQYFDPVSAMGALARAPVRFFPTFRETHAELLSEGYVLFALEPAKDFETTTLLHRAQLPEKTAFVLGNERHGLSFSPAEFEQTHCASIAHAGATSSLNLSVAAGIALYEYGRQRGP